MGLRTRQSVPLDTRGYGDPRHQRVV